MILRRVSTNSLAGLLEALAAHPTNGKADLPDLAATLQMEIDELFPIAETLHLLRFVEVEAGDIHLTPAGRKFAEADVDTRKNLFGRPLTRLRAACGAHPPRARRAANHQAPAERFMQELEDYMSDEAAETHVAHGDQLGPLRRAVRLRRGGTGVQP